MSRLLQITAIAGWLTAMLIPLSTLLLWIGDDGIVYLPELVSVTARHVLNAGLTVAIGAAIAPHPATDATVTLSFTIATGLLDFEAAVHYGWWERAASYTPAAVIAQFQHRLVQLSTILIALTWMVTGICVAAICIQTSIAIAGRIGRTIRGCLAGDLDRGGVLVCQQNVGFIRESR